MYSYIIYIDDDKGRIYREVDTNYISSVGTLISKNETKIDFNGEQIDVSIYGLRTDIGNGKNMRVLTTEKDLPEGLVFYIKSRDSLNINRDNELSSSVKEALDKWTKFIKQKNCKNDLYRYIKQDVEIIKKFCKELGEENNDSNR